MALDVAYGELDWRLRQDPRVTVAERVERPRPGPVAAALRRRISWSPTSPSSRWPRCCPRCWPAPRRSSTAWRWSSRSSRSGASRWARAAWSATRTRAGARWWRSAGAARELGAAVLGFASSGLPGPAGNRESFVWLGRGRPSGRGGGSGGAPREGRSREAAGHDHGVHAPQPRGHGGAAAPAGRAGGRGRHRGARAGRGGGEARPVGAARRGARAPTPTRPPTWRWCMGGDGTILTAMRRFAGRGVPVFAMNFGEIGFLATVERDDLDAGFGRALRGEFEVLAAARAGGHDRRGRADRGERHLLPPPPGPAGGRAGLLGGGRAARRGALRRPGGGHPGGVDGLQPGQRRAGAGVGRGRLRGLLHRAAHPHRAGAGGRAGRRPRGGQPLRRASPWT